MAAGGVSYGGHFRLSGQSSGDKAIKQRKLNGRRQQKPRIKINKSDSGGSGGGDKSAAARSRAPVGVAAAEKMPIYTRYIKINATFRRSFIKIPPPSTIE
jgi:hypothetical protein